MKEDWDCSFAYVLCSLANVHSDTAFEQLLGRVMRMPYAKNRKISSLNKDYAYVLSSKFGVATDCIVQKLGNKEGRMKKHNVIEQKTCDFGLFGIKAPNKIIIDSDIVYRLINCHRQ